MIWLVTLFLPSFLAGQSVFHSDFERESFQTRDPFRILIASQPEVTITKYREIIRDLEDFTHTLKNKKARFRGNSQYLEWVFYQVHRNYLDWYEQYVPFSDIFSGGTYDCLTGTALYSVIFDQLGIPYEIYEFDFHVFLIAQTDQGRVLIESTDPLNGVISDEEEILARIRHYESGDRDLPAVSQGVGSNVSGSQTSFRINKRIDLKSLTGLQYYNLAIREIHAGHPEKAIPLILKAEILYPGERVASIKTLLTVR